MTNRKLIVAAIGLAAMFGGLSTASAQTAATTSATSPAAPATPATKAVAKPTKATAIRAGHRRLATRTLAQRRLARHERRVALKREMRAHRLAQAKVAKTAAKETPRVG